MLRNHFFLQFFEWLEARDELFRRFELLAAQVESYILEQVLWSKDNTALVAENFEDVISHCDTVDYDAPGVVEAYSILHFLDRFHRFQLIYLKLLEEGLLPIKSFPIDVLDVGTGPGPTLFALSDIYSSLKLFGAEVSDERLTNLTFTSDYVEYSKNFREWLHHFTEHSNYNVAHRATPMLDREWKVPYHFGSFRDFRGLDLRKVKTDDFESRIRDIERYYDYADESPPERRYIIEEVLASEWKNRFRYDLIIFSNFLTKNDQVMQLANELRSAGLALRNRGVIVVVGGRGGKYQNIYPTISNILCKNIYPKKKTVSKLAEVQLTFNEMEYNDEGRYGDIIRNIYRKVLDRIREYDEIERINPKTIQSISRTINTTSEIHKWAIHVYRKSSWSRNR
jgi:hypothetical protein